MKQKPLKKKLSLNKQTIAQLDQLTPQRMDQIQAGVDIITQPVCGITVQVTKTVLSYLTYCTVCLSCVVPVCVTVATVMALSEISECPDCNNDGDR